MSNIRLSFIQSISRAMLVLCIGSLSGLAQANSQNEPHPTVLTNESLRLRMDVEGVKQPIFAKLEMNATTRDLLKQLPISLNFTDYASSERIANLPQRLTTQGAPNGYAGRSGDLTYYAPWGNLAFFYKDSKVGYANGLVYLGKLDALPPELLKKQSFKMTIRQVSP